ncbi:MAG: RluA family pseudouridine synthase [candidate division KSB1 bacterium]|nr:RluA family pseudouridine synthase [candidate division KSB1 bacterium]
MSPAHYTIVVPPQHERQRLDRFLHQELPHLTRARIQRLIEEGNVRVGGAISKPGHRVRPQELIEVTVPEPKKLEILPEAIPLHILYEDEHLLVLDKPAGMVVHPAFANYTGTLVNALLAHCQHLSGIGGVQRPGIVHRLDKETSGVMVVAKSDEAHVSLSQQFATRQIQREYRAVVWGHFRVPTGRIETLLRRSPKNRLRMTVSRQGKLAVTNYEVLEKFRLLSLVRLTLGTGRTHQIRVHMAYIGHPVFGDATYGGRSKKLSGLSRENVAFAVKLLKQFNRPALHALSLGFVHPISKEHMYFEAPLPDDLVRLLAMLEQAS